MGVQISIVISLRDPLDWFESGASGLDPFREQMNLDILIDTTIHPAFIPIEILINPVPEVISHAQQLGSDHPTSQRVEESLCIIIIPLASPVPHTIEDGAPEQIYRSMIDLPCRAYLSEGKYAWRESLLPWLLGQSWVMQQKNVHLYQQCGHEHYHGRPKTICKPSPKSCLTPKPCNQPFHRLRKHSHPCLSPHQVQDPDLS